MIKARFKHPTTDDFIEEFHRLDEVQNRFEELIPCGVDAYEIVCPLCGTEMTFLRNENIFSCTSCYAKMTKEGLLLE